MIIPPWIYLGGAALALSGAGWAGWTVRDWKCEADAAEKMQQAAKDMKAAASKMQGAAQTYEEERSHAETQSVARQSELRTIYRDVRVPVDCAAPDAARGLLKGAVDAANARTGRQPESILPDAP